MISDDMTLQKSATTSQMHGRHVNTILMKITKKDGKLEEQYESRVKLSRSQTNERVENTSFDLKRYILFVRSPSLQWARLA